MNQRISEKTPRRKAAKRKQQTVKLITEEIQMFTTWLKSQGVNISEFTRELWKVTPEFEEFKKIKDKEWLKEE